MHGIHNLSISYFVYDRLKGCYVRRFYVAQSFPVKVFFEKYEIVHGVLPNWYYFYFKDNVVNVCNSKVSLSSVSEAVGDNRIYYDPDDTVIIDDEDIEVCGGFDSPNDYLESTSESVPIGCPKLYIFTDNDKGYISLTDFSVTASTNPPRITNGTVGKICETGLECLYATIVHEFKHLEHFDELVKNKNHLFIRKEPISGVKVCENSDNRPLPALHQILEIEHHVGLNYKPYFDRIREANNNNRLIMDSDGDGLSDEYERVKDKTRWLNSDTFDIANLNDWDNYRSYGDDEYFARKAEENDTLTDLSFSKDWAFPGANIAREYSGEDKRNWKIKETEVAQELQAIDKVYKRHEIKMVSNKKPDIDTVFSGPLFSMPKIEQHEIPELSIVGLTSGVGIFDEQKRIRSIDYTVTISNHTQRLINSSIKGFLASSNEVAIAWSANSCSIAAQKSATVKLSFSGEAIYSRRVDSILILRLLHVYENTRNGRKCVAKYITNVATGTQYALDQYVRKNGYLFCDKIRSYTTNQTVVLDVPIEINGEGAYKVKGILEATNGTFVAGATTQVGSNDASMVQLVFNGEDIYRSQQKGPYNLASIQILDSQNKVVDGMWDAISLEDISYERFKNNNSILSIAHNSFKEESRRISADGKYDGLFFGFVCTNTANEDVKYQVSGTLLAANNIPVAKCSKEVILTNGCNYVSVIFNGASIKDSGTDGPYVVSQIEFTPIVEGGCSERFLPVHAPIELKACDFGQVPFTVSGAASCREVDKYSPIVVDVPVHVLRSGEIIASAIITDRDGNFLLRSETNIVVSVGSNQTVSVAFSASELMETGSSGPYVISYLLLRSGYEGIEEIRIDEFEEIRKVDFSIYVDAAEGNDDNDGLTDGTAKKTIAAAIAYAPDGATIRVRKGDYRCLGDGSSESYLDVKKRVSIVAEEDDPSKTRIIGPGNSTTNDVRGVWLADGASISGFTIENFSMSAGGGVGVYGEGLGAVVSNCIIRGCSSSHDGGAVSYCTVYDSVLIDNSAQRGGGAAGCTLVRCVIDGNTAQQGGGIASGVASNCVIRNCLAVRYGGGAANASLVDCRIYGNESQYDAGGAYQCTMSRCRIENNKAYSKGYGGGMCQGAADNCVIYGNSAYYAGGSYMSSLTNCTVAGNVASMRAGGAYGGNACNSIFWGNTLTSVAEGSDASRLYSNVYSVRAIYTCSSPLISGEGNICADPQFLGEEYGALYLKESSPCLDRGTLEVMDAASSNMLPVVVGDYDIDGKARIEGVCPDLGAYEGWTNACIVAAKSRGYGTVGPSVTLAQPGEQVALTATSSKRPFLYFEMNGDIISENPTITVDVGYTNLVVYAVFGQYEFHVDAEKGDDSNDGLSWDKAKRTLQAAVDEALDGETIHVAKGVYAPVSTSDKSILIESVAGASETVIDGGGVARCAYLAANSSSVASQTNTVLSGFTLMNGHSTQGAGAYGGTLRNCVIRDNVADGASSCGGGTYYGVQHNCRYIGNLAIATTTAYGGAAYYGTSYDCSYIDNSASGPTDGLGGAVYYGTHYNCALTNNTASSLGGGAYGGTWHNASVCKNKAKSGGGFYYGTVYDSRIEKNKASGAGGGAYYTSLTDCEIVNNQAEGNGGGAFLTGYTATRCVFVKNRSNSSGGGVYQGTCTDCEISDNIANSNGGGVYNITATRTSFMRNTAASGGGIYNGTYRNCVISENTSTGSGGGAYGGTFYDSVISGNYASGSGGGIYNGTYHRTKISGNRAVSDGGGTYSGTGYNSLLTENHAVGSGGGNCSGYLYNCTVSANRCGASGGGTYNGYHYNSVIVDNFNPDGENNCHSGSRYYCMCENVDNPRFVNPAACDYRLREGSGCVNAGYNSYANGTNDLSMAVRIQGGTVDIGAYEGAVKGHVVTVESVGGGICTHDPHVVTNGGSFSISAQPGGRAFLHFKTNGIIATTSQSLTLEGIIGDVDISAEFAHELFVDGVNGRDGNDGFSWAKAKKTIQAAIDVSIDGDTIWVAGGVYAPIVVKGRTIEIISTEGPERTIIDGGGVSCCAWLGDENFYQFATDTRLSGFTLRHGYREIGGGVKYGRIDNCIVENCRATGDGGGIDYSSASNCIVRYNLANASGGGAIGNRWHRFTDCQFIGNTAYSNGGGAYLGGNAIFRNCRFSGNVSGSGGGALYNGVAYDSVMSSNKAASGGGTYNGTFYRCELNGNTSSGDGGGAYSGTFYDCIVSNNIASGAGGGLRSSTFHRTRVFDNFAAGNGGGVYSGTGYNSIIARNRTDSSGGGSCSGYNYNCTVAGNYCAAWGGGTYGGSQYNTIVWGNRNAHGEYNCEGGGSLNNCCTANPKFVNVREGDYRLRTGSSCLNAGNASYVNGSSDVDGKTRVQDGTVDIGAHEGAVEGFVVDVTASGGAVASCSSSHVENGGTFTVSSVQTERPFVGVYTNGVLASVTLPFTIDNISADIELTIECAHDLYVDGDFGDDSASGLSWDDAKRTIQGAIDASFSGDVIHVADGWYEPFSSGNRDIRIVSENGPENCIVDGEWSQRCATLGSKPSEVQTVIEGLTLYGGYASSGGGCYYGKAIDCIIESCYSTGNGGGTYGTLLEGCLFAENTAKQYGGATYGDRVVGMSCVFIDNYADSYGGAVCYGSYYDCLFDGNSSASRGGAASEATLVRCELKNNESYYGGGTYYGTIYNCLYYDNYASYSAGGAYYGTLYNCTLTRNRSQNQAAGMYYSTAYNTICWGNKLNSGSVSDTSGSSFYNCCLSTSSGSNTIALDPIFFNPDNDDFRLSMESPCLDVGNNSNISQSTDILGNARIHNGTVDIGCYEGPVYIWQISAVACGEGRVDASGTSVLDGGSLSFVAVEEGSPFLGFYTNGVFATAEKSFTWENISSDGTLEAWFKQDYYVNASMLDDNGDGLTWETARKSLATVVSETSNGANIWVKGGVYASITSLNKHLVITAVEGVENTVISGAGVSRCATLAGDTEAISAQTNTVIVGFTLRNGVAVTGAGAIGGTLRNCLIESNLATQKGGGTYYGVQTDCIYRNNIASNDASTVYGGAAYYGTSYNCVYTNNIVTGATNTYGAAISGGVHYDCVIFANKSSRYGGGVYSATCHRCKIFGNNANSGGGCASGTFYDSLIYGNSARMGGGGYSSRFYGCTVVGNIATNAGGVYSGAVYNSIVWDNQSASGSTSNWINTTMRYSCSAPLRSGVGNICEAPLFVDAAKADYRLTKGSLCLNAGGIGYVGESEKDLNLRDRVQDEVVDMGLSHFMIG